MIEAKGLSFSYSGAEPYLIQDLDLKIPKGMLTSIIGENGSAKSTFVKLALGLLKPIEGSIEINTDRIGYVPQRMESFNSQFPITVEEVYRIHLHALGQKDRSGIDKALNDVSMLEKKHSLIGDLSGGQQQRVFIGRALLGNPEVIVLDEPSTGMDIRSQKEVREILKKLRDRGVTIVAVEHNISAAIHNSDFILRMGEKKGAIYDIATFKRNIQHEDVDNMLFFSKEVL